MNPAATHPENPPEEDFFFSELHLLPGVPKVATSPTRYTVILGSCVAVCIHDAEAGIGGAVHFLLPGFPPEGDPEPMRWAGNAVPALIDLLLAAGANRDRLEARVFGGAAIGPHRAPGNLRIGYRNIEAALRLLAGIPLHGNDIGGHTARQLVFETRTGKARVRPLVQRIVA